MRIHVRYLLSVVGAAALVGSVMTDALASHPLPVQQPHKASAKRINLNGNVYVNGILRVSSNNSVYGHMYAHNGAQVWKGLLVRSAGLVVQAGGIKSDSVDVLGPLSATQATISGNLQAGTLQASGAINGSSLALTAGTGGNGTLTAAGKITGNGVDAGAGGVTTSGSVTGGNLVANGNINATGSITAPAAAITNLSVTGAVNFTGANVTGLNLSGSSISSLTVGSTNASAAPLTLAANGQSVAFGVNSNADVTLPRLSATLLSAGCSTTSSAPLTVCQNGKTASLGVDQNGALTASNLTVTGTLTTGSNFAIGGNATVTGGLTVNGTSGVITPNLQAPNAANTSTPGPLTLAASTLTMTTPTVNMSGNLNLLNGGDLSLSSNGAATTSHFNAGPDRDVAGAISVGLSGTSAGSTGSATYTYGSAYPRAPSVVLTPSGFDIGSGGRYWVDSLPDHFTVHVVLGTNATNVGTITMNYHVTGI